MLHSYNVSTAIAIPIPPPTHNEAIPLFLPVLNKEYTNVTNTRAPTINQSNNYTTLRIIIIRYFKINIIMF